jgi:hypothetical protein
VTKIAKRLLIIDKQIDKALKGDSLAFSKVMDRLDGKPVQSVDLTTESKTINVNRPTDNNEEKPDT